MSSVISKLLNDVSSYDKMIHKKELEISKRKELVDQMAMSEAVILKGQAKEDKIDRQIENNKTQLEAKIMYFRNEIHNKEEKLEKDIRDLREKYENYRSYCNDQIRVLENKFEGIINHLESQKQTTNISVADDKIMKKLEIELEQLNKERNERYTTYLNENEKFIKAKQRDAMEDLRMQEEKMRMEEHRKRELFLIEKRAEQERAEKLAEEKRQKTKDQIESIMRRENCSYEVAKDMYMYSLTKQGAVQSQEKQKETLQDTCKQIRLQFPHYKYIVSELDKEYTEKMVRLEGDALVKFLESMKPLIDMKLQFDEDETLLDEKHQEIYSELTLDQQLECIKLKTKEKRYKYLEKLKKTRSQKINDSLGCV